MCYRVLFCAGVCGLILAGCGGSETPTPESQPVPPATTVVPQAPVSNAVAEAMAEAAMKKEGIEGNVSISGGGDGISVSASTDEHGDVSFQSGSNLGLPDGFPDDIPLPDGLNIIFANSATEGSMFNVQAASTKPMSELSEFFKTEAPKQGWSETANTSVPNMMMTAEYEKEDRVLQIAIQSSGQLTIMTKTD